MCPLFYIPFDSFRLGTRLILYVYTYVLANDPYLLAGTPNQLIPQPTSIEVCIQLGLCNCTNDCQLDVKLCSMDGPPASMFLQVYIQSVHLNEHSGKHFVCAQCARLYLTISNDMEKTSLPIGPCISMTCDCYFSLIVWATAHCFLREVCFVCRWDWLLES